MLNSKKFIFFDLDGVLVDTREIHFQAFHESLKKIGIIITAEEHREKFDGLPTSVKLEYLRRSHNISDHQVQEVNIWKQKYTVDLLHSTLSTDIALVEILETLQNSFRMCVCSNARTESLKLTLKLLGIGHFFEFILSQEDVVAPKPSPEIYLEAVKRFDAKKSECIIFENSPHGIKAAENAGISFVEIKDSYDLKKCLFQFLKIAS